MPFLSISKEMCYLLHFALPVILANFCQFSCFQIGLSVFHVSLRSAIKCFLLHIHDLIPSVSITPQHDGCRARNNCWRQFQPTAGRVDLFSHVWSNKTRYLKAKHDLGCISVLSQSLVLSCLGVFLFHYAFFLPTASFDELF